MIADDAEVIRKTLRDMLTSFDHQIVAEAVDGIETVEKFFSEKHDLLLLDIAMPKRNGFEALFMIMEKDPKAKVIMVSAHHNRQFIDNCLKIGAKAYIPKPFDINEFLDKVSSVLKE